VRKLLWIGDAGCQTGFARATHYTLEVLRRTWDVRVLGLNFRGDPHDYPYKMYPAFVQGSQDAGYGFERLAEILDIHPPELIVIQNDPWNFPAYMRRLPNHNVVGAVAVDGLNCKGAALNGLTLGVFWTQFGLQEARLGGFTGRGAVVPLGVDLDIYKPGSRQVARERIGLPKHLHDKFIIGNVNRNQPRKRLDLTIAYFAEWVRSHKIDDAYLFLHVAPTADEGIDCAQLAKYYGVANRLITSEPEPYHGIDESMLAATYHCFDAQFSTTQGEGWGLTTMEGMACGIPQIVPDWSALGEWPEDAVLKVPCSEISVTPKFINTIGGVMDRGGAVNALGMIYQSEKLRSQLIEKGLELVSRPQYRWEAIGQQFSDEIDYVLEHMGTSVRKDVVGV
jgi:D-inositol-3-phosphate glycosyltransferase